MSQMCSVVLHFIVCVCVCVCFRLIQVMCYILYVIYRVTQNTEWSKNESFWQRKVTPKWNNPIYLKCK